MIRKINKKLIIGFIVVIVIIVVYILRYQYINNLFPKSQIVKINFGEEANNCGFTFKIISGQIITGSQYVEKYIPEQKDADVPDHFLVANVNIKNNNQDKKKWLIEDIYGKCKLWSNQLDPYIVGNTTLNANESKDYELLFGIYSLEGDIDGVDWNSPEKEQWLLQISNWPYQQELIIPVC